MNETRADRKAGHGHRRRHVLALISFRCPAPARAGATMAASPPLVSDHYADAAGAG